jgi:hypothetical protein
LQVDEGWGTPTWLVGGMMLGLVVGPALLCLVGLGGLALVIFFIIRGSQGKVHFSQSKVLFILAWISSAIFLGIGSLFYFPLFFLVSSEALVAILGAGLLRASKLSVFTITLLANLLTISIILFAINFKGDLDTTLVALIAWLITWVLEGVFLGLCLRRELGFVKSLGLVLAMNLASLVVGFLLPAGMGIGL